MTETAEAKVFEVKREDVDKLLEELGYHGAEDWKEDKVLSTLKEIPTRAEEDEDYHADSEEGVKLFDEIMAALTRGDELTLTGTAGANGKSGTKKLERKDVKKGAKAASNGEGSKGEKTTTPKVDVTPRDSWGSAPDSDCGKVNQLLTTKPQTESEIRKAAGVKNSVEYHLDKQVRKGLLAWEEGKGYYLRSKTDKAKPPKGRK